MTDQAKRFGAQSMLTMYNMMTVKFTNNLSVVEKWATEFKLPQGGPFHVKIGDTWYVSQTLILCNGAAAKWLGAPGEAQWINRGISGCATCDAPLPFFRNKHICVVGGGDSAMEGLYSTVLQKLS